MMLSSDIESGWSRQKVTTNSRKMTIAATGVTTAHREVIILKTLDHGIMRARCAIKTHRIYGRKYDGRTRNVRKTARRARVTLVVIASSRFFDAGPVAQEITGCHESQLLAVHAPNLDCIGGPSQIWEIKVRISKPVLLKRYPYGAHTPSERPDDELLY